VLNERRRGRPAAAWEAVEAFGAPCVEKAVGARQASSITKGFAELTTGSTALHSFNELEGKSADGWADFG
jgi:hypothetical protein